MKRVLVTGGNGRFCSALKKLKTKYEFIFTTKKQLDILSLKSIKNNFIKYKPDYILHLAGLSRPLVSHDKDITRSINLNIIGTCNVVNICNLFKKKIIYFSTGYVYQGVKGNYKEDDPLLPWNNYAWSKLGGESAVQMYKNSLILRVTMTEKPFIHKEAYANVKTNFIYHDDVAKLLIKLINRNGVFNVGGKSQTIYDFVKKDNRKIIKKYSKGEFPLKQNMNLSKLKSVINS